MASALPKYSILRWLLQAKQKSQKGFTLTELLVSVVMGTIIIGTLLYLVVELLGVNTREETLTQTQQDMKRALDYMTRDVSEAVYLYDTPDDVVDQLDDLDDLDDPATPILAFWRLDPVDISELGGGDCEDEFTSDEDVAECSALKVRHNVYTLVVYLQQTNTGDDIWEGPSRIIRYELTKYADIGELEKRSGYSDPSIVPNTFVEWTKEAGEDTDGTFAVLTDFVDSPQAVSEPCPTTDYLRTPALDGDGNALGSFVACVREGNISGAQDSRTNQSLVLYLTGNATTDTEGNDRVLWGPDSQASRTPTLKAEVLIRGVIEKRFD